MGVSDDDGFDVNSDELRPNVKSLPFNEHRIEQGEFYINKGEQTPEIMLMSVHAVPTGMICSLDFNKVQNHKQRNLQYDMRGDCTDRCFEGLPGYIDVKIMANYDNDEKTYMPLDEERLWAYPCCLLKHANKEILQ